MNISNEYFPGIFTTNISAQLQFMNFILNIHAEYLYAALLRVTYVDLKLNMHELREWSI